MLRQTLMAQLTSRFSTAFPLIIMSKMKKYAKSIVPDPFKKMKRKSKTLSPEQKIDLPVTLAQSIMNEDWNNAHDILVQSPDQASLWTEFKNDDSVYCFYPIQEVCWRQPPVYIVETLVKIDAQKLQIPDFEGMLPIHRACKVGTSVGVCKVLLEAFPLAASLKDDYFALPLHYACWGKKSCPEVAKILIDQYHKGLQEKDVDGYLPIHYACSTTNAPEKFISFLIDMSPDTAMSAGGVNKSLPVHLACESNAGVATVSMFLTRFPDVMFYKDEFGRTPRDVIQECVFSNKNDYLALFSCGYGHQVFTTSPKSCTIDRPGISKMKSMNFDRRSELRKNKMTSKVGEYSTMLDRKKEELEVGKKNLQDLKKQHVVNTICLESLSQEKATSERILREKKSFVEKLRAELDKEMASLSSQENIVHHDKEKFNCLQLEDNVLRQKISGFEIMLQQNCTSILEMEKVLDTINTISVNNPVDLCVQSLEKDAEVSVSTPELEPGSLLKPNQSESGENDILWCLKTLSDQMSSLSSQIHVNNVISQVSQNEIGHKLDKIDGKLNQILATVTQSNNMMVHMTGLKVQCPRLAVLLPTKQSNKRFMHPKKWFQEKMSLYFLCAYDYTPVEPPVTIKVTKQWVQKASPFLTASIFALQAVCVVGGISVLSSILSDAKPNEVLLDFLKEFSIDHASDQMRDYFSAGTSKGARDISASQKSGDRGNIELNIPELTLEAYAMVSDIVNKGEDEKNWKKSMKLLQDSSGNSHWVKTVNADSWKMNHQQNVPES
mmetsp:Transcript_21227/g.48205  ORF Transcript_21227/g.48205 Transcript_21227/m.48205 type:complete len:779 (-) Transcript_21227:627-2963(-)